MRIVLVFPRTEYVTGDPPLGLAYLAAVLRKERPHDEVAVIDGTFLGGESRLLDAVRNARADVVGVHVDCLTLPGAQRVARLARANGSRTVAGGPMASVVPTRLVDDFDAVVVGEGEGIIAKIVDRLGRHKSAADVPGVVTRDAPEPFSDETRILPNLDELPFPAWDLLEMPRYMRRWPYLDSFDVSSTGTNVVGSRGCAWRCTFCQPTLRKVFGPKVRLRAPSSIVAEVMALQERYGLNGVFFHDDTITMHEEWLRELCDRLSRLEPRVYWGCNSRVDVLSPALIELMESSGMRSIHLGIEAASDRVRRDVLGKGLVLDELEAVLNAVHRRGVHALGFFMIGSPTESLGEILETIALARRLPLTEATFSLTAALPGTELHRRLSMNGEHDLDCRETVDYYNRRNHRPHSAGLGDTSLRVLQFAALGAFYLKRDRLEYVLRHFESAQGREKMAMKMARFVRPWQRSVESLFARFSG